MTDINIDHKDISEADIEQHLREVAAYGFTNLVGCLDSSTVADLLTLTKSRHQQSVKANGDHTHDDRTETPLVNHLYKEDKAYTDILVIEPVKQILMSMLNDPYYPSIADGLPNYILGQYTARSSGARRLQLHIDSVIPAPGDRTWSAQVVYVLEDMSLETGSTQVIPGTHLSGKYTDRTLEPQSLVAHAGDVIIWDSRLWHGTNPNLTTRTRWVLIATVQAWWMKQKYEITSAIPNDLYARLSDEQKQVLGFCSMPPKVDGEYFDIKGGYERLV